MNKWKQLKPMAVRRGSSYSKSDLLAAAKLAFAIVGGVMAYLLVSEMDYRDQVQVHVQKAEVRK